MSATGPASCCTWIPGSPHVSCALADRASSDRRDHTPGAGWEVAHAAIDDGSAYRCRVFARAFQALGIKYTFTCPYRPKTNGKAERFIQTLLREWAYAFIYPSSGHRSRELPTWMDAPLQFPSTAFRYR